MTFLTLRSSRLANLNVFWEFLSRYIEITILTIFWFHLAFCIMSFYFIFFQFNLTKFTLFSWMKFFLMLFLKIFIIILSTSQAFDDIPSTIPKMSSKFTLLNFFVTIITCLHQFLILSILYFYEIVIVNNIKEEFLPKTKTRLDNYFVDKLQEIQ